MSYRTLFQRSSLLPGYSAARSSGHLIDGLLRQRGFAVWLSAASLGGCGGEHAMQAAAHDPLAHCRTGFLPDARDGQFTSQPVIETVRKAPPGDAMGDVLDTLMPAPVVDWLFEQGWPQQHDDWHNIRRWDQNCRQSNASPDVCNSAQSLLKRGLWRAPIQEGASGDGYGFLAMHRHMIQGVKQAFPSNADLFAGFRHIPRTQQDGENPHPWLNLRWSPAQLSAIDKLEQIEAHLDEFPTEDDLGLYIEVPFRWTPENPSLATADPSNGIHFGLHAQWSVNGSSAALGNGPGVINNYVFWKLHGWIDDVWARYRRAKGIPDDDTRYVAELRAQCAEMHALDELNLVPLPDDPPGPGSTTTEKGLFAEKLRPILEAKCASCHGAGSQVAGLQLGGGGVSSASIVKKLVGITSTNAEWALVVAGDPTKSWLYLKASAEAASAACAGTCNRGPMPPAGDKLTSDELTLLRQWISDGAKAPE